MPIKIMQYLLLLSTLLGVQVQAAPILTLDPNGVITGEPGGTIGWGFTLSNDTADYLVVTGASLSSLNTPGYVPLSTLGFFTDFISQHFFVVDPSGSIQQVFDLSMETGVGSFVIDPGALSGVTGIGEIVLTYDLFSVSPNNPAFNPDTDIALLGSTISASATVNVVPEPNTMQLLLLGFYGPLNSRLKSLFSPRSASAIFG